jgi:hypothetical protein
MLSVAYYVVGALVLAASALPLLYAALGFLVVFLPQLVDMTARPAGALPWVANAAGGFLLALGLSVLLLFWAAAGALFFAGRSLARQTAYTFCLVMACLICLAVPLGTILGIFTLMVLTRPGVRPLFT